MIGQRFGSLTVDKAATRGRYWCKCDCGKKNPFLTVPRSHLLGGKVTHCRSGIHKLAAQMGDSGANTHANHSPQS